MHILVSGKMGKSRKSQEKVGGKVNGAGETNFTGGGGGETPNLENPVKLERKRNYSKFMGRGIQRLVIINFKNKITQLQ